MLTTIKLNGILGVEFAPEIKGELNTPQEVINFLCCNFPDFRHYVLGSEWHYTMVVKGNNWERYIIENSPSALLPVTGCVVEITPVVESSGRTLTSIAMIGIGIALVATGAASGLGISLILSGATSLLSSLINGNPKKNEEARSTFFQAAGYNVKEGTPIPLVFGEVLVKNFQVLSNEISSPLFPYVDLLSQEQNMATFAKCPIMFIDDYEDDSSNYPNPNHVITLTVKSTTLKSPILAGENLQLVIFGGNHPFFFYYDPFFYDEAFPTALTVMSHFNIGDTKLYCNPTGFDDERLSGYSTSINLAKMHYKQCVVLVQSQTYP